MEDARSALTSPAAEATSHSHKPAHAGPVLASRPGSFLESDEVAAPKATIILTRQPILANLAYRVTRGDRRLLLLSTVVNDMGRILKA